MNIEQLEVRARTLLNLWLRGASQMGLDVSMQEINEVWRASCAHARMEARQLEQKMGPEAGQETR